ncbi:MAG: DNA-directed polymerase subunit omega [Actinomycetota bacterium]|jgi:DNA-directed RNA polymerase subunit omega
MRTNKGIIDPPIDELLDKVDSKYQLVIVAAKRARQINDYYQERAEGTVITAGPLVESTIDEKPLTIAMREINEGLVELDASK